MPGSGERWPPVYDADDLQAQIKQLSRRPDLGDAFYEWRRDRSQQVIADVCQGDVIELMSEVPLLVADGQPSTMEHPDVAWLVIGNTCDIERVITDVRWTQIVPIYALGRRDEISANSMAAIQRYTQSRTFHVPEWSAVRRSQVYTADLLRPVTVDKRALHGPGAPAIVQARLSRAAWILLNACLVRFLARDDGRYA